MNRVAKWMMRLYPVRWRKRYGDELDALLADTGADARIVADLAKGGIRMQFSTWSFLKLAVVLGIVGMVAGLGFSLFTPTSYVAATELHLTGTDSAVPAFERLQAELTSRWRLSTVINDPAIRLYADEQRAEPLDDVIEQMRRNDLSITIDGASTIAIRFAYPDRTKAEHAVRVLSAYAGQILAAAHGLDKNPDYLDVLDTATLPTKPLRPDARITAACGLAIALLLALPFRRTRRRILMFSIAGFAIGGACAWIIPSLATRAPLDQLLPLRYESRMTMFAAHADPASAADLLAEVSSRSVMGAIIADPRLMLYREQQKTRDISEIADTMLRDMTITTQKSAYGQMFHISFVYSDRFRVQQAVGAVAAKMREAYEKEARLENVKPSAPTNWGVLADAANPRIAVESIAPNREIPMLFGLAAGLSLAAIIALVRRRWILEDEEPTAAQPIRPSRFSSARFRKLAFTLAAAGVIIGAGVEAATPPRYASEASFILRNSDRWKAANLTEQAIDRAWPKIAQAHGLDPITSRRALTWREIASIDMRLQRIEMRFASDQPRRTRDALDDALGAVDRAVGALRGVDESPYETIRGVDGALLPIPSEHYPLIEQPVSSPLYSRYNATEGIEGPYLPQAPANSAASVVPASESFHAAVPATERRHEDSIAFDDERAKPAVQPESRMQMEVIDSPSFPTAPEGMGWWKIAIGAAAGFALAILITIFSGFFGNMRAVQIAET